MAGTEAPSRAFQRQVMIQSALIAAASGAIFGVLVAMFMWPKPFVMPDKISVRQLDLIDQNGKIRGGIVVVKDNPMLMLLSGDEKANATLSVVGSTPRLDLTSGIGNTKTIDFTSP
jgi:hypothetical protein